jgi:hypothetical protein
MTGAPIPFRYYLRVRYIECDAQKVVFNSRYSEYVDVGINEFLRAAGVLATSSPARSIFSWSSKRRVEGAGALRPGAGTADRGDAARDDLVHDRDGIPRRRRGTRDRHGRNDLRPRRRENPYEAPADDAIRARSRKARRGGSPITPGTRAKNDNFSSEECEK